MHYSIQIVKEWEVWDLIDTKKREIWRVWSESVRFGQKAWVSHQKSESWEVCSSINKHEA